MHLLRLSDFRLPTYGDSGLSLRGTMHYDANRPLLLRLPYEVLVHVFEQLNTQDCLNVSMCCKILRPLALASIRDVVVTVPLSSAPCEHLLHLQRLLRCPRWLCLWPASHAAEWIPGTDNHGRGSWKHSYDGGRVQVHADPIPSLKTVRYLTMAGYDVRCLGVWSNVTWLAVHSLDWDAFTVILNTWPSLTEFICGHLFMSGPSKNAPTQDCHVERLDTNRRLRRLDVGRMDSLDVLWIVLLRCEVLDHLCVPSLPFGDRPPVELSRMERFSHVRLHAIRDVSVLLSTRFEHLQTLVLKAYPPQLSPVLSLRLILQACPRLEHLTVAVLRRPDAIQGPLIPNPETTLDPLECHLKRLSITQFRLSPAEWRILSSSPLQELHVDGEALSNDLIDERFVPTCIAAMQYLSVLTVLDISVRLDYRPLIPFFESQCVKLHLCHPRDIATQQLPLPATMHRLQHMVTNLRVRQLGYAPQLKRLRIAAGPGDHRVLLAAVCPFVEWAGVFVPRQLVGCKRLQRIEARITDSRRDLTDLRKVILENEHLKCIRIFCRRVVSGDGLIQLRRDFPYISFDLGEQDDICVEAFKEWSESCGATM